MSGKKKGKRREKARENEIDKEKKGSQVATKLEVPLIGKKRKTRVNKRE